MTARHAPRARHIIEAELTEAHGRLAFPEYWTAVTASGAHARDAAVRGAEAAHQLADTARDVAMLFGELARTWPVEHDDDPNAPGYCACGVIDEKCPTRRAHRDGTPLLRSVAGGER